MTTPTRPNVVLFVTHDTGNWVSPYRPNDCVFAEKTYHDTYDPTRAVRDGRYKYIRYFEVCIFQDLRLATETRRHQIKPDWRRRTVEEVYDLTTDPDETNNLIASPAHAGELTRMRAILLDWMRRTGDPLLQGPVSSPYYQRHLQAFLAGTAQGDARP